MILGAQIAQLTTHKQRLQQQKHQSWVQIQPIVVTCHSPILLLHYNKTFKIKEAIIFAKLMIHALDMEIKKHATE